MEAWDMRRVENFGPTARYSEYQVGEVITFRDGQEVKTGTIIYVQEPEQTGYIHHPLTYVVDAGESWPLFIYQTDVVERTGEATLASCPYCFGMHMSDQIEQCPFKHRHI